MTKYNFFNDSGRSHKRLNYPTDISALSFDELYDDISDHWQDKAKRLQARRWRKLKYH